MLLNGGERRVEERGMSEEKRVKTGLTKNKTNESRKRTSACSGTAKNFYLSLCTTIPLSHTHCMID